MQVQYNSKKTLIYSCCLCIVLSQLFFGVLHWFSFEKTILKSSLSTYNLIFSSINNELQINLELGKTLERYNSFASLVENTAEGDKNIKNAFLIAQDGQILQRYSQHNIQSPSTNLELNSNLNSIVKTKNHSINKLEVKNSILLYSALKSVDLYRKLGLTDTNHIAINSSNNIKNNVANDVVNNIAGYFVLELDQNLFAKNNDVFIFKGLLFFGFSTLAAIILFLVLLKKINYTNKHGEIKRLRFMSIVAIPLFLVQSTSALAMLYDTKQSISITLQEVNQRNLRLVKYKIEQVLNMGIKIDEISEFDQALKLVKTIIPELDRLYIVDSKNKLVASSDSELGQSQTLAEADLRRANYDTSLVASASLQTRELKEKQYQALAKANLKQVEFLEYWIVSELNPEIIRKHLLNDALDAGTIFVVSMLLMSELILLQLSLLTFKLGKLGQVAKNLNIAKTARLDSAIAKEAKPSNVKPAVNTALPTLLPNTLPGSKESVHQLKANFNQEAVQQRALMRLFAFCLIIAIDLSISFIPMRMEELLVGVESSVKDILLGLPISIEMGAASAGILFAGVWSLKRPSSQLLYYGVAIVAIGYLLSAFSTTASAFVAARAVVGLGYGFGIMALQSIVVSFSAKNKQGANLTNLFAGVYAGGLCGSVVGAMLSDRFGYSFVFIVTACILTLLCIASVYWAKNQQIEAVVKEKAKFSFLALRHFCFDKNVVMVILFSLLPSAIINIGLLNFFLPIFLNRAGVNQSDIGRVFMVYCLVFIFVGPKISHYIEALAKKSLALTLGGVIGGLCLLLFALPESVISPFWVSIITVILLGLFLSISVTAQNSFLLNCSSAQKLGHEQTMSIYNIIERLGQVAGPLIFGAAMLFLAPAQLALFGGGVFIAVSTLIYFVVKEE